MQPFVASVLYRVLSTVPTKVPSLQRAVQRRPSNARPA